MEELNPTFGVILHVTFFVLGMSGNIFILLVHFLDWLKTRSSNTCAYIITCIGFANISLQGSLVVNEILFFMFNSFYSQPWVIQSFVVIIISLSFCSLWFATCLCFYFCVKITNLSAGFFHKMKANISAMVPWILLLSFLISWAAGLTSYWDLSVDNHYSITPNCSGNATSSFGYSFTSRCSCLLQIYIFISSLAFTVIFLSAGAIIASLCQHMSRMKKNKEGSGTANLESHRAAAKTVTSLLVLYMVFYGAQNIMFNEPSAAGSWYFSLCIIVVSCFPAVNALVLITGNRKLKNVLKRLFGINDCDHNTEDRGAASAV